MPARPNNRQQNRPQRGDYTGNLKEKQTKEKEAEVRESEKRMAMLNRAQVVADDDAVHDPTSGAIVAGGERADRVLAEGLEEIGGSDEPIDLTQDPVNVAAARADAQPPTIDENLAAGEAAQQERQDQRVVPLGIETEAEHPVEVPLRPDVVVRAADDVDQMTVGHGTTYTMEMGKKYRVPHHVAEHMETRGLIWH